MTSTPLLSSTMIREPKPLRIAMVFFMVMFCRGSPWIWIHNGTVDRERSPKVAKGDQTLIDKRYPLKFHTLFRILETCSCFENLNRKRFGPRTTKEKGMAKNQLLDKAAFTDWLFWIFWEITLPTRWSSFVEPSLRGIDSSWEEGSSQVRVAV